jgi:spore coat protein CotH
LDTKSNEFLLEFEPWPQYSNPEWIVTPRYHITLGFNDPESPTEEQRKYIEDFFDKAEKAISTSDFEEISKYLDIQSFVDAFIVQEFFKQVDYATSSTRFYIKDGKLYEGPVWDFDLSSGNCSSTYYTGYNNVSTTGLSWQGDYCYGIWNARLFRCKEFEQLVKERYKELQPLIVNVYKDNEIGKNLIDSLLEEFRDDIDRNYTVWSTKAVYSELEKIPEDGTYDSEIAYLRDWLENRNAWMCERYGINADAP